MSVENSASPSAIFWMMAQNLATYTPKIGANSLLLPITGFV
jgi:hypothetical protein